jgi:hypothetical protein
MIVTIGSSGEYNKNQDEIDKPAALAAIRPKIQDSENRKSESSGRSIEQA